MSETRTYAEGGWIRPDEIEVNVQAGERVLTAEQVAELGHRYAQENYGDAAPTDV